MPMIKNYLISIILLLLMFLGGYLFFSNSSIFSKYENNDFRNLSFSGEVIEKKINKELGEKTNTVYLSDSTKYRLPLLDLDAEIEIGDYIVKQKSRYEITIFKRKDSCKKIIYALPLY
jgi:hypothetical protein